MKDLMLLLFVLFSIEIAAQEDSIENKSIPKIPIHNLVETLSECNCIIMSMRGDLTSKEQKMLSMAQNILFDRSFKELDSLFIHGNEIIQLYAFGGICTSYPENLNATHLTMLKTKGKVKIYQQISTTTTEMKKREIASIFYQKSVQIKEEKEQKFKIEKLIQDFILSYASSPSSYTDQSFEGFHVYSTHDGKSLKKIKNSENYSIKHIFKIKNNQGDITEVKARFILNHNMEIMLIEEELGEEGNTVSCFHPMLDWWLENFGRKLTNDEQKKLNLIY